MAINSPLLMTTLLTLHWYGLCSGEHVKTRTQNDTLKNNIEAVSCIGNYHELELYVRQNTALKDKLMKAFYKTGQIPSEYVLITYNFEVSRPTSKTILNSARKNNIKCSSQQSKYIWSDNFLYILGPQVLFWFTLTVVEVREGSVTIDLPCLCRDVYNDYLSRLTYMSKVYATMDYDGGSLQFIRSYYIQAKHLRHGIYPSVTNLLYTILQFSIVGMAFISYLTINYIHPKICSFIEWYSMHLEDKCSLSHSPRVIDGILIISFVGTNLITTIFQIIAHMFAIIKFIDYGNEILNDADQHLTYVYSGFAVIPISVTMFVYILAVCISLLRIYVNFKPLNTIIPMLTSMNIIYFLTYFSPFLFLALIQVPLLILTLIITYIAFIIIWSLLTYSFVTFVTPKASLTVKCQLKECYTHPICILSIKLVLLIMFLYAIALICIIVMHAFFLGSYNNSPSTEAIVIAILAGVVGSVVFKSAYKKIKVITASN